LPGPTDDYLTYRRWFDAKHSAIILPADCKEPDPTFTYINQQEWRIRWFLIFESPASHISIKEHFTKVSGLQTSRRHAFAYHYGPTVRTDAQGMPQGICSDPLFVRIDNAGALPVHLHHEGKPADHVPQKRVEGLKLIELDLFDFVSAALRHRTTGKPIEHELGYRIV
jgi:hypothetical protein